MRYMRDGSPIPSHISSGKRPGPRAHYNQFKLMKGIIVRAVYPEETENKSKEHLEFIVKINGRNVPGCSDIRNRGAIYNYSEKTRKIPEKSITNDRSESTFDENFDAEFVYVLFLNGDSDYPVIIGSDEHPRHPEYKKASKADGTFDRDEFNGVEVQIDKDSNYTVTQLGRKDCEGEIENPDAVGAIFKMGGDGSIELSINGNSININNADGKIEIQNTGGKKILLDSKQTLGDGGEAILLGSSFVKAFNTYLTAVIAAAGQGALIGFPQMAPAATALQAQLPLLTSKNSETD